MLPIDTDGYQTRLLPLGIALFEFRCDAVGDGIDQ